MQTSMKSRVLTDSVQCWSNMTFFKVVFMMRMAHLNVVHELNLICKFHKWLYYLHKNNNYMEGSGSATIK